MLTIKTLETIKRGARITYLNGVYAIVIGALYLAFMKFILKTDFKSLDVIWQVFAKYNPGINNLFYNFIILKGVFIICIGIAILYLSSNILKRKEKGTWISLFLIGIIFWSILLTIEIMNKNLYAIIATFIGWLMFIIGMLLPIRYYVDRDYTEY